MANQLCYLKVGAGEVTNVEVPSVSKGGKKIIGQYYKVGDNLKTDLWIQPDSDWLKGWRYVVDYAITLSFCFVLRPGATNGIYDNVSNKAPSSVNIGTSTSSSNGPFQVDLAMGLYNGSPNPRRNYYINGVNTATGQGFNVQGKLNHLVIHKPANTKNFRFFLNGEFTDQYMSGSESFNFTSNAPTIVAGTLQLPSGSEADTIYFDVAFFDHVNFSDAQLRDMWAMYKANYITYGS